MKTHRSGPLAVALAAAFFPAGLRAQEAQTGTAAPPSNSKTKTSSEAELKAGSGAEQIAIPERILKVALASNLDLSSIKVEGGQWVGCKEGDVCIPLGSALPGEEQKGKMQLLKQRENLLVEREYSPEYLRELADLIKGRRDITVVLVVSVPPWCEWCRVYAGDIDSVAKRFEGREDIKLAVINFDTYAQATRIMGEDVKRFPFTAIFRKESDRQQGSVARGGDVGTPFFPIGRNFEVFTGRKSAENLRRTIEPPLLKR